MPKKPETLFKEKCIRDLRDLVAAGGRVWWVKTQMVSIRGIPDFLICVNGTFWAMELKKDLKSKPDKLQEHVMAQIRRAGGHATVETPETWPTTMTTLKAFAFGHPNAQ